MKKRLVGLAIGMTWAGLAMAQEDVMSPVEQLPERQDSVVSESVAPSYAKPKRGYQVSEITSDGYEKFRVGGYGEMVAQFKDYGINRYNGSLQGNTKEHRATIAIPRFVIAMDYKFTQKWILGAEIEFEAGGTGSAYELENSENGEYETEVEKGGEVALEQFHITRVILPELKVRVGHLIVPVGLTNAHHEPVNFYGTVRPEGETTMIPSTWHETGIELCGTIGGSHPILNYEAMIVAGLNANGFDRNGWVKGGKAGIFETDNFTSPAYVGRLEFVKVKGLRVSGSGYYVRDAGKNSDKRATYAEVGRIPVRIYSADVQYKNKWLGVRMNVLQGRLGNAEGVSNRNGRLSNKSPYSRTMPVAQKSVSYGGEMGLNLRGFFAAPTSKVPALTAFARYEYYNTQKKGEGTWKSRMDDRNEVSMWVVGLNWYALKNTLVIKADYTTRQIGTGKMFGKAAMNSENEFGIGVAYVGWFWKK